MTEKKTNQPNGRRRFLQICLGTATSGFFAAVLYPLLKYLNPPPDILDTNGPIEVPTTSVRQMKSLSLLLHGKPVIIIADKDGFHAYSAVCSHLGCAVKWDAKEEKFICPCHSAHFDKDGKVISGPPPKNLEAVPLTVKKDKIILGEQI
jgi:cytochrome b6-f complex iron-sulfur subunit